MSEHGPVYDTPPGHTTHLTPTQLQHALEHVSQPIYVLDPGKQIQYVNDAFTDLTGYNEPNVSGDTPRALSNGYMPDEYYTRLWDTVENGDTHETTDYIIQTRDGEILHTHHTVTPVTDDTNTITEYVATITDTTEQQIKNQQVHTFSRILRHDIRTKTNIVAGYLEEIQPHTTEPADDYFDTVENTIEEIIEITDKTTTIRNTTTTDIYDTKNDLEQTIETVVENVHDKHPDATFIIDLPDHSVHTTTNAHPALREIIENAVEHDTTDTSTQVTITVEPDTTIPSTTTVSIIDNGPGIQQNEIDVLETPLETSLEHGNGLGIWHARWVVTRAGGEITISTPPDHDDYDHGTQVTVTLPAE